MMFYIFFFLSAVFGFFFMIWNRPASYYLFLLPFVFFPSSLQFGDMIYKNGMYWVDGAVIGGALGGGAYLLCKMKIKLDKSLFYLLPPFFIIFAYFFVFISGWSGSLESLKDFRPAIYLLTVFLFGLKLRKVLFYCNVYFLAWGCVVASLVYSFLFYFGVYEVGAGQNPGFRYLGFQTFFCISVVSSLMAKKDDRWQDFFLVISCYAVILISESRMLFVASLIPLAMLLFSGGGLKKRLFCTISIASPLIIFFSFDLTFVERMVTLYENGVWESLLHRMYPAIREISDFKAYEYLVGGGFGKLFFIDWFVYREGVNNYSVQVDSLYLTFFAKYGIFSVVMIFCIALYFSKLAYHDCLKPIVFFMLLMMFASSSFLYHIPTMGFIFGLMVFRPVSPSYQDLTNNATQ